VYELWFRQILHELDALRERLGAGDHTQSFQHLRRLCTILKTLVGQVDVLETMSPVRFGSFRSLLESSSGMQSTQFREIEFVCGRKSSLESLRTAFADATPSERQRLEQRLSAPTVFDAFLQYLRRHGHAVPAAHPAHEPSAPTQPSAELQATLIEIYRSDPSTTQICELLVDFDEGFQEWRYRHVKMVERTIGERVGTGGSAGVHYLRGTLFTPFFPDLWSIRDRL